MRFRFAFRFYGSRALGWAEGPRFPADEGFCKAPKLVSLLSEQGASGPTAHSNSHSP